MGNMKRFLLGSILMLSGIGVINAQDSIPAASEAPAKKPFEKAAFESGYFIADQTVSMPPAKTLELVLQHDFGTIDNHWSNLWGIWGSSNIRIGFNFTITKDLQVGFETTKNKLMQDFSLKYSIMRQRKEGFPVSITFFGNMAINADNKSTLGNNLLPSDVDYASIQDSAYRANLTKAKPHTYGEATKLSGANEVDNSTLFDYTFKSAYRFSYFGELMFARRFCKEFSAQVGISFTHYNLVDGTEMAFNHIGTDNTLYNGVIDTTGGGYVVVKNGKLNNNVNLSFLGRLKVSPQSSLVLSYSFPLMTSYMNVAPWPNFGLGWEVSTSTHTFQVFLTAANGILPQEIAMYNPNNPFNGYILLGFNITRLWTF